MLEKSQKSKAWDVKGWPGGGCVSWVFLLAFAFAVSGDMIAQFSTMVTGYLVPSSAEVHRLSLSSICLCWCVWSLSGWYRSSGVEGAVSQFFFFKWYLNVMQSLFYPIIVIQNGYTSSVQLCLYLMLYLVLLRAVQVRYRWPSADALMLWSRRSTFSYPRDTWNGAPQSEPGRSQKFPRS